MNNSHCFQAIQQMPMGMISLTLDGSVLEANPASLSFWGGMERLEAMDFAALLNTDLAALVSHFRASPQSPFIRSLHLKPDALPGLPLSYEVWLQVTLAPIFDEQGQLQQLILCHQDVSDQEYSRQAIESIALGVSSLTGQDFYNSLVVHLAGIFKAKYAFIGLLNKDADKRREITTLALCTDGQVVENFTYSLKGTPCDDVFGRETCCYPQGVQDLFPEDILLQEMGIEGYIGAPIAEPDGTPMGIMVVLDNKPLQRIDLVSSILEIFAARAGAEIHRQNAEQQILRMAYEDYLTRLPNRAQMHEYLQNLINKLPDKNTQASLLLIDLDHFKTLNDALGHDVGDEIIRKVGERLSQHLGDDLFLARIGGDEFVVIQCHENCQASSYPARLLADRILFLLTQPFQIGDRILNIGASIGIVQFPEQHLPEEYTALDLLRYADIALYQAKSAGRDQALIFSPEHQDQVNERLDIERGLRTAMESDQLRIYMQPQVNHLGIPTGAEVLLRWIHPEEGIIRPMRFIPIAEETGLILKLGHWVLDQTLGQLAQWQQNNVPVPGRISVNVSAWQFTQQDFTDQVIQLCRKHQVSPEKIVLEVTETALLQDIAETRTKLTQLRQLGFRISLDDFGTGYSSLAYLRDLPLDELKIDKTFIDEVKPGHKTPLVESMLAIGQHMKMKVVAEGVETQEQLHLLKEMGCTLFQGYHFSKPMPAEQLPEWFVSAIQTASACH